MRKERNIRLWRQRVLRLPELRQLGFWLPGVLLPMVLLLFAGSLSYGQAVYSPEKPMAGTGSVGDLRKWDGKWNQKWDRIRLQTLDERVFRLSALHKKLVAVVFLSPECPLCQNYSLVLNKLQERFGKDLDIAGVFPGKANTIAECRAFREKYHIRFVLLTDTLKTLVKMLGARITPEVFLLDEERNILYHGAIDNWVASLGKQRSKATENYLEDGIADHLNGEAVKVKEMKAIGCFINDY